MPNMTLRHLDGDLYEVVKAAAREAEISISEFIANVLREKFDMREWVHAYSIQLDHIEYTQCSRCGGEFNITDLRPMSIKFYRLYDQNDRFRVVVCENCLSEI